MVVLVASRCSESRRCKYMTWLEIVTCLVAKCQSESILVRSLWTSIEYNQLDFGLLVLCAAAFSLLNEYCLVRF